MPVRRRHWTVALAAAFIIHIAVAALAMWREPTSGAAGSGLGGIEVSLGSSSVAPATATAMEAEPAPAANEVMPEAAEPVEETTQAQEVEPVETEAAKITPVAEEAPQPEAPVEPLPEMVEPTAADVTEPEPIETVEAAEEKVIPPIPRPKPERPAFRAEPKPKEPPERRVVEREIAETRPTPARPEPRPRPQSSTASARATTTNATSSTRSGAAAENTSQAGNTQSTQTAAIGGGIPGDSADYLALLRSWLERHKEYPRRARLRRQEGTALLYFVMDRQGRVLEYRLRRSSGYPVLDSEVEEMIRRAQPLPAAPAGFGGTRLEFVIPVRFHLR